MIMVLLYKPDKVEADLRGIAEKQRHTAGAEYSRLRFILSGFLTRNLYGVAGATKQIKLEHRFFV